DHSNPHSFPTRRSSDLGIGKPQDQGDQKDKNCGNQCKPQYGQDLGEDELLLGQAVDQILFDRLVAVFIGHHRYDHNGQKELEQCGHIGVEVPDIGEVEDALFGQVELDGPYIEFNGRDQCDRGQQHKIGNGQYFTGPVVPEFDEFYLKQT